MNFCYFDGTGRYQTTIKAIEALIPASGDVKDKGKAIERYRRAFNVYYDLHNNGLCNRFGEVRTAIGVTPRHYGIANYRQIYQSEHPDFVSAVETRIDELILEAALEQGIDMVELSAHERLERARVMKGRGIGVCMAP